MIDELVKKCGLKKGDVFIDIGTHKAEEVSVIAPLGIETYCIEPNRKMIDEYIIPKVGAYDNVHIIHAAAWKNDGTTRLYSHSEDKKRTFAYSLIKDKVNVSKTEYTEVPCINTGKMLEGIVRLHGSIKVLKIDAEGAEYTILNSIVSHIPINKIQYWYVEDHEHKIDNDEWLREKERVGKMIKNMGVELLEWHD